MAAVAVALVCFCGCDFFRSIAGRPTSAEIEVKRQMILAQQAAHQAMMDSVSKVEKQISDSLALVDSLAKLDVKVMNPSPFEAKDITERILRGFLSSGKVVERAQIDRVCRTLGNNLWYINHFMSICDHLSKGYITEPVLQEAMDTMISLSLPRFCSIVNDLTDYQINLLRAVAEGQSRFSSADMIRRYGLSSSANVKRIKDALSKKEIVTFSDTDEASIIDPLFEFWVKKYFFRQEIDF